MDWRSQKSSPTDDIPLAHRRHSTSTQSGKGPSGLLLKLVALSLLGGTTVVWVLLGPWRGWFPSPTVAGLGAKPTGDGRLLGHFPYPEAQRSQLVNLSPGMQLRSDAAQSFIAMQRAAAADGIALTLLSAFRSIETQRELFFDVKSERNQTSLDRAKVSAPPGFSEHSTGYAIDVGDLREPHTNLSPSFTNTKAYHWLMENAARFHFTLSFPRDNPQGVSFEPWHWRFEGSSESLRTFEAAHRFQLSQSPP